MLDDDRGTRRMLEDVRRQESAERRRDRIARVASDGSFEIVFQPIVELASGATTMVEALARFPSELAPAVWMADAERAGLTAELDLALARRALEVAPDGWPVSVNISPLTLLDRGFLDLVAEIPTERLVVEVTEHARVDDYTAVHKVLVACRKRGVRVAIDDAGAGYASLRHILDLAPDVIKLDMYLVRDAHIDPARRALVSALVTFASEMGAELVAEGIERPEELATLRALGVRLGQGYLLGRPVPAASLR